MKRKIFIRGQHIRKQPEAPNPGILYYLSRVPTVGDSVRVDPSIYDLPPQSILMLHHPFIERAIRVTGDHFVIDGFVGDELERYADITLHITRMNLGTSHYSLRVPTRYIRLVDTTTL